MHWIRKWNFWVGTTDRWWPNSGHTVVKYINKREIYFIIRDVIWNAPKSMWKMYFSRDDICILFWNAPKSKTFTQTVSTTSPIVILSPLKIHQIVRQVAFALPFSHIFDLKIKFILDCFEFEGMSLCVNFERHLGWKWINFEIFEVFYQNWDFNYQ